MGPRTGSASAGRPRNGPPLVSVGGVTLDTTNRRVMMPGGGEKPLTPLQAALLAHLMSRSGRVCSRAELMCQALGYQAPVGTRTVDVHVATLRNKLGDSLAIRSVRGVGYKLEPRVEL